MTILMEIMWSRNWFNLLASYMTNLIKREQKQTLLPVSSLGGRIDHLFGDFFSDLGTDLFKHHHHVKNLKVNVSEDDKAYYVEAPLAGFKKENVKINCKDNILSIEAKREDKKEESKKNYYCAECYCGSFFRNFQLPEDVNASKLDAEMKDGLLKITLPKSEKKFPTKTNIAIR